MPLYILPFDHRQSFLRIIGAGSPPTADQVTKARDCKRIIYDAFVRAVARGVPQAHAGILVDEWLGCDILREARAAGFVTCAPLEMQGRDEFEFEGDYRARLAAVAPTYAKVLVRYNAYGDSEMNARQAARLAELGEHLAGRTHKYLIELLVPPLASQLTHGVEHFETVLRPGLLASAVRALRRAGVSPDVWKIEGYDTADAMREAAAALEDATPGAAVVILGRGESAARAEHWLRIGAAEPCAVGFAVGRTVFTDALQEFVRTGSRDEAVERIAGTFSRFVDLWRSVKAERAAFA